MTLAIWPHLTSGQVRDYQRSFACLAQACNARSRSLWLALRLFPQVEGIFSWWCDCLCSRPMDCWLVWWWMRAGIEWEVPCLTWSAHTLTMHPQLHTCSRKLGRLIWGGSWMFTYFWQGLVNMSFTGIYVSWFNHVHWLVGKWMDILILFYFVWYISKQFSVPFPDHFNQSCPFVVCNSKLCKLRRKLKLKILIRKKNKKKCN